VANLKIVVFDCDGVLFDSRDANRRYYNDLLGAFGRREMTAEELQYVHTHNAVDSTRHIFRHYSGEWEQAESLRRKIDYAPYLKHMVMEPGLREFLQRIRRRLKTAISTNRTTTMPSVLAMSGLEESFDMVVTALDVRHPKPHPEALKKILAFFRFEADEGVYIGDSDVDEQHAARAGVPFIAFRNSSLTAEFHVGSFAEASRLPLFEGLAGG
jgi:HAD superfamily hydrolase (TIGR01509 family)